jgi:hypothetical protein
MLSLFPAQVFISFLLPCRLIVTFFSYPRASVAACENNESKKTNQLKLFLVSAQVY